MKKIPIEFEAKVIKIDKDLVRKQLKDIEAKLVFPEKMFTRMTFDTPPLRKINAWVRLRDEGGKITLAYKCVNNINSVSGTSEVSLNVDNMEKAKLFVEALGLKQKGYQQNLREEWQLNDVIFNIDTWPMIDPWLEIEAANEETVKKYFQILGYDFSQAKFGSADGVYKSVYGIEILDKPELVFTSVKSKSNLIGE